MKDCCKKKTSQKKILLPIAFILVFGSGIFLGNRVLPPASGQSISATESATAQQEKFDNIVEKVIPSDGYQSKISFRDAIIKMETVGVIDREKMEELYKNRGGVPQEITSLLDQPSDTPIKITRENAAYLINMLWPLGISNRSETLTESEAGKPEYVNSLAATGGWTLGKVTNGGEYYNQFSIVPLNKDQEELVKRVASNIYRPCCGNSTAMPDCNHGAAMLGLLELGASQGLSEEELYNEALQFNSYWFPDNYSKMAVMMEMVKGISWTDADPKTLLGADYSSGRGYSTNVEQALAQIPGLLPQRSSGGSCSA